MAMFTLTGFQRDLLFVIAGSDQPSGQDIKEQINETTSLDITHGRLYPNLDALVNNGFVEKGEIDRRTNYYSLTPKGREAINARREWVENQLKDASVPHPS